MAGGKSAVSRPEAGIEPALNRWVTSY